MEVRNFNINNFDELCVSGYEIERGLGELRTDIKPAALKVIVIHIIGRLGKKRALISQHHCNLVVGKYTKAG